MASISHRFFDHVVELFMVGFFGFSGLTAWLLITQSSFFQQPLTTRIEYLTL